MNRGEIEIKKCTEWLKLQTMIKTLNPWHTSYAYKHMVERWGGIYVSHDSFKEAVKKMGIKYKHNNTGVNMLLPLSEKTLKKTSVH
ncbi:MAG: hypothetical protein ACYC8S_01360 [Minisyncoccota bacterium]